MMKKMIGLCLLAFSCISVNAQRGEGDTLRLSCFLTNAVLHAAESRNQLFNTDELKLVLSSTTDTVVKACIDAEVTTVQREADGTYEIVFTYRDYWFWLSGLQKATVRAKQKFRRGDPIGILSQGSKLELLLFDFETPVDPRPLMDCNKH